jgi:uncharacterized protein with GYD domain
MPFYMTQWTYKEREIKALVSHPQRRIDAARKLFESFGGKLHHFFFAFGEYDGLLIAEMPDNEAMTACLMTVVGAGGVGSIKTIVLLTPEEAERAMTRASSVTSGYTPPSGQEPPWRGP